MHADGIIAPLFRAPMRHVYRLVRDREYRRYSVLVSQLHAVPRHIERVVRVHGRELLIPDAPSFLSTYKEIFVNGIYESDMAAVAPRILDLGANVGLSVLFFKLRYPQARITALEADPKIFEYLTRNVHGNGWKDVVLMNQAAWDANTTLSFASDGADGGRLEHDAGKGATTVAAMDVRQLLERESFDFIKMDIEGAESVVLPRIAGQLGGVSHLFVEYHSRVGERQNLAPLLSLITDAGFRINVQSIHAARRPFLDHHALNGFDLQLNIFAWK